jgi:hypothetical protein
VGPEDRRAEGVVEMTLDATENLAKPVTNERLFGWQAALFPPGFSGMRKIKVGGWRDGALGVVSGQHGPELVHFEGPPADRDLERWKRFSNGSTAHRSTALPEKCSSMRILFLRRAPLAGWAGTHPYEKQ